MNQQDQQLFRDEDLENAPVRHRPRVFEPVLRKDFVRIMAAITKRSGKDIAILTAHWPKNLSWHYHVQSECKLKKTEEAKAKFINWFIREAKLKKINK